jgi:hypothetical protein
MLFGAANIDLGALGIPDVTGYREHLYQVTAGKIVFPSVNGPIPAAWPTTPAGVTGFYTIYPNPDQLLAGQLDETLRAFIGSAPPQGGVLTGYAEADGDVANGGQFASLGLTKAKLLQVHAHLQALCRGSRVKYGAVVCGTGLDQVLFCPPGLDFYALDWYDNWNPPLIRALNAWRENLVQHVQESPVLAIAETNSNVPAQRPSWFATVYGWLAGYSAENGGRALGYWSYWRTDAGVGSLSGPWLPDDAATIAALTRIAAHCKRDM